MIIGFLVAGSAESEGWSFIAAVSLASTVGFAVKIAFAIAAQKWIGHPLGKNPKIRYM